VVGRFLLLLTLKRIVVVVFATDTSDLDRVSSELGYGSILQLPHAARKSFGEWWSLSENPQWHITMKELVAVRRDILRFTNDLRGHTVCLYEDNQSVVDHQQSHVLFSTDNERASSIGAPWWNNSTSV
jgi:hypothetical protein